MSHWFGLTRGGAVLAGLCLALAVAPAWPADLAVEDVKPLVVLIEAKLGEASLPGSGIIFGKQGNALYIATANHVVREGKNEAREIWVRFRWLPDSPVRASLMPRLNSALDLAVLRVEGVDEVAANTDALPFERVRAPDSLKRGESLFLLGFPNRRPWRMNVTPEKFVEQSDARLDFESTFIAPGHSGGALLDERFDLVGMLTSDQPPYGVALAISAVLETLRRAKYPVHLGRTSVPGKFSALSAGRTHVCALSLTGAVYCWGALGTAGIGVRGSHLFSPVPVRIRGGLSFRAVSAGAHYTCAISKANRVYCWGNNGYGQLGTGAAEGSELPAPVAGGLSFKAVSAGDFYTCAIAMNDAAHCWGSPGAVPGWVPSDARADTPQPIPGALAFRSVSPNHFGACGVTTSGTGYCWGAHVGKVPVAVANDMKFHSVNHNCLLGVDGAAYCWDDRENALPQLVATRAAHKFQAVSGGSRHSCAIDERGVAYCWGWNERGGLGNGRMQVPKGRYLEASDATPLGEVAGGLRFQSLGVSLLGTCGVTTAGVPYCWGPIGAVFDDAAEARDYGTVPARVLGATKE